MTVEQLYSNYQTEEKTIADLEAQMEAAKVRKSAAAKAIETEFGKGPHTLGGQPLSVFTRKDHSFLRTPMKGGPRGPRKKKDVAASSEEEKAA